MSDRFVVLTLVNAHYVADTEAHPRVLVPITRSLPYSDAHALADELNRDDDDLNRKESDEPRTPVGTAAD